MRSILLVFVTIKKPKPSCRNLRFLKRDEKGVLYAKGEDPLILLANISSFQVRRILIDTSNFVDILTTKVFYQIGLKDAQFKPASLVYVFSNNLIAVKRSIILPMVLGDGEHTTTKMVNLLMVDYPMAYSIIFGRITMLTKNMVMATFFMMTKFSIPINEGNIKAD